MKAKAILWPAARVAAVVTVVMPLLWVVVEWRCQRGWMPFGDYVAQVATWLWIGQGL